MSGRLTPEDIAEIQERRVKAGRKCESDYGLGFYWPSEAESLLDDCYDLLGHIEALEEELNLEIGYRNGAMREKASAQAENARLRAALEGIAAYVVQVPADASDFQKALDYVLAVQRIARETLEGE